MRGVIVVFGLLLVLFFAFNAVSEDNVVEQSVFDEVQENGSARIIVYLKDDVKTGYGIFSAEEEVNVQDVVNDFNQDELSVTHEYGIVKGFAGSVSEEGLEKLRNDKRVERVYYDTPVKIFLQNSVPLINATKVYPKIANGLNLTGANQTICVIDTGINASLPELAGRIVGQYCYCSSGCCPNGQTQDTNAGDDNGHGTHVAGIIAANGSSGNVNGVAPGARIVMIKTMNSAGVGSSGDIVDGINYCVSNKSLFNISVISMSLGGDVVYTTEDSCQSGDPIAVTASAAVANGIFVAVASGNDGSTTGISGPACAKNVTSVGAVTKNLAMASYTNRNSLLDLLAPGGANDGNVNNDINSSTFDGSNAERYKSGTSMATPHVAGAAALLMQYKKLENGTVLSPFYVEDVFKRSGFNISDAGGSGLTFSMIDINAAIIYADSKAPDIVLSIIPGSANFSVNNVTLNFSVIDTNLGAYSINVSYPNGSLLRSSNANISLTTANLSVVGNYTIVVFANDSKGNVNLTIEILSVVGADVVLVSPVDYYNSSGNNITFNCSATSYTNLKNISLYTNVSGGFALNQSVNVSGTYNSSNFTLTDVADGNYLWNCRAYDVNNNSAFAAGNRTFRVDTLLPIIQLLSPENDSNQTDGSGSVVFKFNATDTNLANCSLVINDAAEQPNKSIISGINNSFTKIFSSSNYYNWGVNCSDYSNNKNGSVVYRVNVSVTTTTTTTTLGGGGGSPGGGGSAGASSVTQTTATTTTIKQAQQQETSSKEKVYEDNGVDIKGLEESNPDLKTALSLTGKSADKLAVASNERASVARKLESSDGVTTVETRFSFKEGHKDIIMYDEVPKIFAADASKINVDAGGGEYKVVKADPIYVFTFPNVEAGKEYKVSYSVVEYMPGNVIDVFEKPILMYDKSEEKASLESPANLGVKFAERLKEYKRYWWAFAAGVIAIILAIILILMRKKEK